MVVSGETLVTTAAGERRYGPGEWYETHANQQHSIRFDHDTVQVELRFDLSSDGGDVGQLS